MAKIPYKPVLVLSIVGLLIAAGCAIALYIAGNIIDERQIDPDYGLVPLFLGLGFGVFIATTSLIAWTIAFVVRTTQQKAQL